MGRPPMQRRPAAPRGLMRPQTWSLFSTRFRGARELLAWTLVLSFALYGLFQRDTPAAPVGAIVQPTRAHSQVFVSYSYFEKDPIQLANFEFFLLSAVGIGSKQGRDLHADYFLVLNGDLCTPCTVLDPLISESTEVQEGLAWLKTGERLWVMKRIENEGMDFAAHNASLTYAETKLRTLWKYKYFVFLNSSVKGPFVPKYYMQHWAQPFLSKMNDKVKAVSSSLVCLPDVDAGGPGARLESWAFAADAEGLRIILDAGVFHTRVCKLCADGVVVMGEYGITMALFRAGKGVDTLMAKYEAGVDWADPANWGCNNQVHPSRHGTYDGISMNPYEVVFLKASWNVGVPFADKYADWESTRLRGNRTTAGEFDEHMYRYAIQPHAQDRHPLIEQAYQVG